MGRKKKYTAKELEKRVAAYFASITRTVTIKEKVDTGKKDDKGHTIWEYKPIVNDAGDEIKQIEYVIPPTIGALCDFLNIDDSTWEAYCKDDEHPEYVRTTKRARGRVFAYLQGETLTRPDKALKGILFNISNNFPDFAETADMDRREQELRIAKMEAELMALQKGQSAAGREVTIIDDV